MRFILDAQLPQRLVSVFSEAGHDATHTIDLPRGNRTSDDELARLAKREGRVIVTKDRDFEVSLPLHGMLVTSGNISNAELDALLRTNLDAVLDAFTETDIVAVDGRVVRMVIDPMIPGSTRAWWPRRRVVEHGDERILHVVVRPKVEMAPPADDTVQAFERVKHACENIGRPLLDMMLTDGHTVQRLSLALDPDSPWLDDRREAG